MADTVIFPKLGQTMEEGAIVKWLKREGDKVAKGDILFEIETDKANLEVESFFEGTLLKIVVAEGVTVPVNTVVGFIGTPGETIPAVPVPVPVPVPSAECGVRSAERGARSPESGVRSAECGVRSPESGVRDPGPGRATPDTRPPAPAASAPAAHSACRAPPAAPVSPRARALCRECAVDPAPIRGSGPNGRVVEKDVRDYLASRHYDRLRVSPAALRLARQKGVDLLAVRGTGQAGRIMTADIARALECRPRPMSRMRQTIARRLAESKQTIPHFYATVTADVTALFALRARLKKRGTVFSINDFVLAATARALDELPAVNSRLDPQGVAWRGEVDLGMAVDVPGGLVVPVIRSAQRLSLAELHDRAAALAERARAGRLEPDEMTGSGFTVSNMGMLGVDHFAAIVNPGESGILAVGSAREEAVAVKGRVAVRTRMALTLSADHRLVDGALGARFLNAVKTRLEDVGAWQRVA
jgi:pyruvate dehydrogenase E2 component (dihydrolipoamide acetyltransferase)